MLVKQKMVVTNRLKAECPTHSRTEIAARDTAMVIDEPKERDGTNQGPTPTETLVAALVACTNVIGHKCARKHGVELRDMRIAAEWDFDRRGTQLVEEVETPFVAIRMTIDVTTDADEAAMEAVLADLQKFCPLAKLIRAGGTTIEETWNVTRG